MGGKGSGKKPVEAKIRPILREGAEMHVYGCSECHAVTISELTRKERDLRFFASNLRFRLGMGADGEVVYCPICGTQMQKKEYIRDTHDGAELLRMIDLTAEAVGTMGRMN